MPITISGSTGIAGVDGSAGTPAVQGTDTNTGIVFPAADTVAIGTGGTERMRVDSSGNVGIGTSSPSTYGKFVVAGGDGNTQFNVGTNGVLRIAGYNSSYSGAALESVNTAQSAYLPIAINGLYTVLATGGTERLRIDSSGNVGIGTSAPSQKLEVYAAANSLQIESVVRNDQAGTGVAAIGFNVSSSASAETTSTKAGIGLVRSNAYGVGSLCFYNNATASAGNFTTADERMRIDTSGNLSVGTTAAPGRFNVSWDPNAQQGIATRPISETYSGAAILFLNSTGGQAGNIFQATSSVAYNTSSDYRMKENVAPLNGGLATIAALKPISYDWIIDKSKGEGFIAHELAEHIPLAVTGEKDAINKDGSIKSQGVDYSKIVVHLVAAMQELKADFDAYKAAHP